MSVDLSPDVLNEIQRQVATGIFATPDDVLREALAGCHWLRRCSIEPATRIHSAHGPSQLAANFARSPLRA